MKAIAAAAGKEVNIVRYDPSTVEIEKGKGFPFRYCPPLIPLEGLSTPHRPCTQALYIVQILYATLTQYFAIMCTHWEC